MNKLRHIKIMIISILSVILLVAVAGYPFLIADEKLVIEKRVESLILLVKAINAQNRIVALSNFSDDALSDLDEMADQYQNALNKLKYATDSVSIKKLDNYWMNEIEGFVRKNNYPFRAKELNVQLSEIRKLLSELKFNSLRLLKEIAVSSNHYSDNISNILLLTEGIEALLLSLSDNNVEKNNNQIEGATKQFMDRLLSSMTGLKNEMNEGMVSKTKETIKYANTIESMRLKLVNELSAVSNSAQKKIQAQKLTNNLQDKLEEWKNLHNGISVKTPEIDNKTLLLVAVFLGILIFINYAFHLRYIKNRFSSEISESDEYMQSNRIGLETELAKALGAIADGNLGGYIEVPSAGTKKIGKILSSYVTTLKKEIRDRRESAESAKENHKQIGSNVGKADDINTKTIDALKGAYTENRRAEESLQTIKGNISNGQLITGSITNLLSRLKDYLEAMEVQCKETIASHTVLEKTVEEMQPKIDKFRFIQSCIEVAVRKTEINAYNLTISSGSNSNNTDYSERVDFLVGEMNGIAEELKSKNQDISVMTETINTDLITAGRKTQLTSGELKNMLENISKINLDLMEAIRHAIDLDSAVSVANKNTTTVEQSLSQQAESLSRAEDDQLVLEILIDEIEESSNRLRGADTREQQSLEKYTL